MNLLSRTLLGASLLLSAARALAQHDAPAWTEARAISRAVTHAPEVRRAVALLEESRARRAYAEVPAVGNPTVGVRAMVGVPDVPAATWALVVGLPFDVAGARGRRRGEVELGEREALARVDVAVNDARHRARVAWVDLGIAEEALRIAAARVETAAEVLQRVRARAAAQAATALDVALAERESATALAERAVAARDRETASGRLRDALDLGPTEAVAAPPPPPPELPGGTAAAAVARSAGALAEPRAFAFAASRLRASASRMRAEAVSPLLLSGEVEWQGYAQSSVGVSAQWALPVARTAQGERAEALAGARTAALEGELRARALGREAAAAFEALRYASEELRALDADAVPAAERALSLTESLSESGAVEFFRVLSARQELAVARGRRLQALREAWRARLDLDRATAFDPLSRSAP
jgi:cobalt-zinc-cadmium efflux system outer membrane protein